jgi:hypothetical protein
MILIFSSLIIFIQLLITLYLKSDRNELREKLERITNSIRIKEDYERRCGFTYEDGPFSGSKIYQDYVGVNYKSLHSKPDYTIMGTHQQIWNGPHEVILYKGTELLKDDWNVAISASGSVDAKWFYLSANKTTMTQSKAKDEGTV